MGFDQWRQQQQFQQSQQQQQPQQPPPWPPHQPSISNSNANLFNPLAATQGNVPQTPLTASSQYSPLNLAVPSTGVQNPTQQNPQSQFSGGSLGPSYNEQLERLRQQQGSTFPGAPAPPLSVLLATNDQGQGTGQGQQPQQGQQQWGQSQGTGQPYQPGGAGGWWGEGWFWNLWKSQILIFQKFQARPSRPSSPARRDSTHRADSPDRCRPTAT